MRDPWRKLIVLTTAVIVIGCSLLASTPGPAHAAGAGAMAVIGQSDYTSGSSGLSATSFDRPNGIAIDSTDRRMFVVDRNNSRVLVFNLGADGRPLDNTADFVIGQANFTTNSGYAAQNKLSFPEAVAYDDTRNRLFVADTGLDRVLVYDANSIANNMNASYVLGQVDFTSSSSGTAANKMDNPRAMAIDEAGNRLFLTDSGNSRVLIYDLSALSNGLAASNVIGQLNFASYSSTRDQFTTSSVNGVAFDQDSNRLFVSDGGNSRLMVWNVSSVTNGMAASWILGQTTFSASAYATTQSTMISPGNLGIDSTTNKLYVVDASPRRVLRFDVTAITNGEPAEQVYGQFTFTASGGATTQDRFNGPTYFAINPTTHTFAVADTNAHRVLMFDEYALAEQSTITVSVEPTLSFSVTGYNAGTCNGATITATDSTSTAMNLRSTTGANDIAGQSLEISTNAASGYSLYTRYTGVLTANSGTIPNVASSNATPAVFPSPGTAGFGYTTDHALSGVSTRFQSNLWAAFSTSNAQVAFASAGPVTNDQTHLCVQVGIASSTPAGTYATTLIYTAVPSF
jgi:6-phosphogluconolactonase (cycloisomerase 2 family)